MVRGRSEGAGPAGCAGLVEGGGAKLPAFRSSFWSSFRIQHAGAADLIAARIRPGWDGYFDGMLGCDVVAMIIPSTH